MTKHLVPCFLALCALPAAGLAQTTTLLNGGIGAGDPAVPGMSVMPATEPRNPRETPISIVVQDPSDPFELEPGVKYFLSFDLTGAPHATALVKTQFASFADVFVVRPRQVIRVSNQLVTVTVPTAASVVVGFGFDGFGIVWDNIRLTSSGSPLAAPAARATGSRATTSPDPPAGVPEPATLGLLALGLVGARLAARRRPAVS